MSRTLDKIEKLGYTYYIGVVSLSSFERRSYATF
nr:MAG TPA: hypothetical protein [Caudoviricetes sp.]